MLSDSNAELIGDECPRLHAHTLNEGRSRNREVVVPHEVDGQTGGDAQFGLLDGELLEPKDRHRLEQDLLGPDGLDRLREVAVRTRVSGRTGGQGTSTRDCVGHSWFVSSDECERGGSTLFGPLTRRGPDRHRRR